MLILAIETSCDETAIAVVRGDEKSGDFEVLSNVVSSQVKIHAQWGGVVPNLAAREHLKNIVSVLDKALEDAEINLSEIDLVAVTQGPGLIPALLIGTNASKSLAYFCDKPLLGIHHIEGHIFANYINDQKKGNINQFEFPILALVVSGGHTQLVLMKDFSSYEIVGQTQDDAAGEAFDKIAKIMELGYPGGPVISEQAMKWKSESLKPKSETNHKLQIINYKQKNIDWQHEAGIFPRPMLNSGNLDFSFSGLKTAVLYFYKKIKEEVKDEKELESWKEFICFEAQEAIVEVLRKKSLKAIEEFQPRTFFLAGGVAANKQLREDLEKNMKNKLGLEFACPLIKYCGDNATMIAVSAFARMTKGKLDKKNLKRNWQMLEADSGLELK